MSTAAASLGAPAAPARRGSRSRPYVGTHIFLIVMAVMWLIPLLCRKGGITKRAIGKIQVMMRETRVEIAADKADEFAEAIRRPDDKDRNIYIEPLDDE